MSDSPQSPPKDVDQGAQSPDEEQMNDNQDPHGGAGYEFEGVKEQDRWLPIANGMSLLSPPGRHSRIRIARLMCVELPDFFSALHSFPMSHSSFSNVSEASRASKTDKFDELDANIRNFAPVARIMKNALPDNAKIAKEAKECMQECVSEFISFITSEGTSMLSLLLSEESFSPLVNTNIVHLASEKCQQEKRKTVNGEDILFAMTSLGFENYAEALKVYLSKYREVSTYSPAISVGRACLNR